MGTIATPATRGHSQRRKLGWSNLAWFAALCLLGGAVLLTQFELSRKDVPKRRPELDRMLASLVSGPDRIAPGVVAYVNGPDGTWMGSAGVAHVKNGELMEPDARMRLESVSKIYTATIIHQLVEEGALRL